MKARRGHTLVELLVAMVVFAIVSAGAMGFFQANQRLAESEAIRSSLGANLRIAMQRIVDTVRGAGYGMPPGAPNGWFPWAAGHVGGAVTVTEGAGSDPDAVTVVSCTGAPVAFLSADAVAGAVTVSVDDASALDRDTRSAILIGGGDHARVTAASGATVALDTDPFAVGQQPLTASHPAGTPLCRLDVVSFAVDAPDRALLRSVHDETGFRKLVDDITDLQIETQAGGSRFDIVLTARSGRRDPITNSYPVLTLASSVSLRN